MLVPLIVVVIIMIVGLVIVQMKNSKPTTTVNVPVTIEPPETPVDPVKLDRVKEIVKTLEKEESISPSTTGSVPSPPPPSSPEGMIANAEAKTEQVEVSRDALLADIGDENTSAKVKLLETAKKLIVKSETKNVAIIATVLKEQATIKREISQEKVYKTIAKLKKLDLKAAENAVLIRTKRDNVSKMNESIVKLAREAEELKIVQAAKAKQLAEDLQKKKIQADLKIQAANQAAEQAKKDKADRAAAFRAKMAKYAEDKLAAEATVAKKERDAKIARALEIALKNKALKLEAEAEMKRILDEQRIKNQELAEGERVKMEAAEGARQVQIEENNEKMEEAKNKREEEEAKTAEAKAELEEQILIQKEEAEELRLNEEERMADIENRRLEAETEAAEVLVEETERQKELEKENREIRLEQEDIIRETEEERAAEAEEAEEAYAMEQTQYDELQEQLAEEEEEYLADQATEALASKTEYDATIAADTASINEALDENATASQTAETSLVANTATEEELLAGATITQQQSESSGGVSGASGAGGTGASFFCLSAERVPETDDAGNNVVDASGNIQYVPFGGSRDDQQPTILETTCVEECRPIRGGERCEDVCTDKSVPNPLYTPPPTWNGNMDESVCAAIDGFNWTATGKYTEAQSQAVANRKFLGCLLNTMKGNVDGFGNERPKPCPDETWKLLNPGHPEKMEEKKMASKAFLKDFDQEEPFFKDGLPGHTGSIPYLCIHDGESDKTMAKVVNCITKGGATHHGKATDDEVANSMSVNDRNALIARNESKTRADKRELYLKEMDIARDKNNEIRGRMLARRAQEKEDYLESLRSDCKFEYSKTVKSGLKQYYAAISNADQFSPGVKAKKIQDAQRFLLLDPSSQNCLPCDPYTKEYLNIIKEPSDPGKKSCPTDKIRKTACTPIMTCKELTQKMNQVTQDRHEALLALETRNKTELKELLKYARAERTARGSYDRQVKRLDTVITASQKTRYDTKLAEKKKVWDAAAKEYNGEGQKLFSAYYTELISIPKQLQYCAVRSLTGNPIELRRTKRVDSLNKKYFGNNLPYDFSIVGEGEVLAPDKFAILASTYPDVSRLINVPGKSRSGFSGVPTSSAGPGYVTATNGEYTSFSDSEKIKDFVYGSAEVEARHGNGEVYRNGRTSYHAVHDGNLGTTYILHKSPASRYHNGRRELNKQQGSFQIESGGRLVLLHAKKARKDEHLKDANNKLRYGTKQKVTYSDCAYKQRQRKRSYNRSKRKYEYSYSMKCVKGNVTSIVEDTTKPIKKYTYYTRKDQKTELYNFNDTSTGYTLIANFATNDFWLVSGKGKYFSVADGRVHSLDKSLKCKITEPVISNAIGGYQGMKKHIQSCFDKSNFDCVDVYRKRNALSLNYRKYHQTGYSFHKLILWDGGY